MRLLKIALLVLTLGLFLAAPAFATIGTINIANAPGWTASTSYALKDRVTAGAGWNGTAYTSGQPLCLFGLTVAGTSGSDATVFNTACASATPAAVGGGLDGSVPSGWSSATSVTDGGATWKLLTRVDYVTITGFSCDDSRNWATNTTYHHLDQIVNGGRCYSLNSTFSGGTLPCTSASSGPGPVGTTFAATPESDGTCRWGFEGLVTYTSTAKRLPHQITVIEAVTYQMQYGEDVLVQIWYGGAQRKYYGPEQPGELSPMQTVLHSDQPGEVNTYCFADGSIFYMDCQSNGVSWYVTYRPPSGDSFADNVSPGTGPLRYDDTKGVALYTTAATGSNGAGDTWALGDGLTKIKGLQIKSVHGVALPTTPGNSAYFNGPTNTNEVEFDGNIIEGGGINVVSCDFHCVYHNNVIILNSSTTDALAVHNKYQAAFWNNTIVCAGGGTNLTGLGQVHFLGTNTVPPMNNNYIQGCTNPYAFVDTFSTSGANNATTTSGTPSGTFPDIVFGTGTFTADSFPGTTLTGLTASSQLANSTVGGSFDARVKDASADIYGAAATFSFSQSGAASLAWLSPITPGPDIFGTTRPISGRYDIGAEMSSATSSCTLDSVSLSGTHHFPGGSTSGTVIGTMSASTTGSCASPTWSIMSSGNDHASTTCNVASGTDFQAVGTTLELNTTLAAGSYTAICYKATIAGATPGTYTQAVDITGDAAAAPVKGKRKVGRVW